LEHGVAASEGGHHVGEDGIGDGAGVGHDSFFAELGGVGGDVDVMGAVGFLPVGVAAGDFVVGHFLEIAGVVDETDFLVLSEVVGDVLVGHQLVDVGGEVDNEAVLQANGG